MNQENWQNNDYKAGLNFIAEHEDETHTLLHTENGVSVVLPSGLPLYGAGFYGIFMLAPIILFMLLLIYFLFAFIIVGSMNNQNQVLAFAGCFFLLWGLVKALKLLTSTRDLFPIKYFATLSEQGIATNYSKWHFPAHSKGAIPWSEVKSIQDYSTFFLPGLLAGILKTSIIEITSKNGEVLKIPFHVPRTQTSSVSKSILNLIEQKRTRPAN